MTKAFLVSFIFLLPLLASAQQLNLANTSKITIKGTSTMHDWESQAEQFSGAIDIAATDNKLTAINSMNFAVEVEAIESGKRKMNKLTYEAFDSEENPQISFVMRSVKKLEAGQATVVGDLTMAGSTNSIEVSGSYTYQEGALGIVASHTVDMEKFGMERPTAMLGAIKVGAEITIDFNLNFK